MTVSKRWYQLSMLQMLMVVAIISVFAARNLPTNRLSRDSLKVLEAMPRASYIFSGGWPLTNYKERTSLDGGRLQVSRSYLWYSMAGNVAICLVTIVVSVKLVGMFTGKIRTSRLTQSSTELETPELC